jgi:two-component system, NarL family, sensor kinase
MDPYEAKIYTTLLIAAGIMALIIIVFIITILYHHRKGLLLYKQKINAEITTLEAERKRIASDLHDDLGPLLSAVKLQVNSLDVSTPEDQLLIQKAGANMDTILARIRGISNNLIPTVLIRKGLVTAIQNFIDDINLSGKLKVHSQFSEIPRLPPGVEIHIFRMVQEILHNTIKHSGAGVCTIMFKLVQDKLTIDIKDDGKGFNYQHLSQTSLGLGLQNILTRIELLKGELFIDTKPGYGTKYQVEIPIEPQYENTHSD